MDAKIKALNFRKVVCLLVVPGVMVLLPKVAAAAHAYQVFGELLTQYNQDGRVDYAGLKQEEARLDRYLESLARVDPGALTRNDRFAFYVNAYNAWTIKLILSGYPGVESIKDLGSLLKSPWKRKFVKINGATVSLDHIEHDILRPEFKDPRVHFAVNCASRGCPPLYGEPFAGDKLDAQLDAVTGRFINDPRYNRLEENTLYVSRIFKWFGEDFNDDIIGFFERYASPALKAAITARRPALDIRYLDYDWSLNGR